jgi:poly-gamma-glutamate synthesis protein (capsule biosynthesis protein)
MGLIFVGDYLPGNGCSFEHPFDAQGSLIADMECSLSAGRTAPKAHRIVVTAAEIGEAGGLNIVAATVANNHSRDGGDEGLDSLVKSLQSQKNCKAYGLAETPYAELSCNGITFAIVGCIEPCRSRGNRLFHQEDVCRLIRNIRPKYDRIIVTPHWGKTSEFAFHPSPGQRKLAAEWIHAGADAVIGHHTHTFQGMEWINGRPVWYSLGNFLFMHEAMESHPLPGFGLAACWQVAGSEGRIEWTTHILNSTGRNVQEVDSGREKILGQFFESLSDDLKVERGGANWMTWARRIGWLYLPVAMQSWRARLKRNPVATLAMLLVWSLLPVNALIRFGAGFPDRSFQARFLELKHALSEGSKLGTVS